MAEEKPWEKAETSLNRASAKDAALYLKQIAKYRGRVLRDGLRTADVEFYEAAIHSWTVTQVVEMLRTDVAKRAQQTGQGDPPSTEPREAALRPARAVLDSARSYCVRDDAIPENVEMFERLVGMQRFRDITDRSRLEVIDAAKAAGAM